jgi:hypothetical protein
MDAYLNDPDVIEAMASSGDTSARAAKPSLFGWTKEVATLKDIQDQMIASRGGTQFVPRPDIPAITEMWRRKDAKLSSVVSRIIGTD